ncbi:MAG: hypothetical protein COU47_00575 [Candidatus Niyogibacteria bacterium CG10_big_fil_rev_8_21_14_0_10_46_36]|uniref:Magnesium transporter CorA n=1 Tax=Candidatus Niyogibacteria bacterium CG10_big_fil_rev_8_21_14_0_10_46_36 TaxID=1974726 RepID=A0A2H0TEE5_9BACT|nr:MAG: hypothetical protein COU47_00575 [Candidatus Niyogibacteria bacterium CG10_big_fil_rev_8_21_14_0_10_46_36]
MVTIYHKALKDKSIKALNEFRAGSWLYAEKPTSEELERLADAYAFDIGLLQDAMDPYEVPRLEIEDSIIYIFIRVPYEVEGRASTAPLLIAIGTDFVLTLAEQYLPIFEKFRDERIEFSTTQKTKLVLQILSEVNNAYHRFLNNISRKIRGTSVSIDRIDNKDIIQFVTFEHILNDFISALVPINDSLRTLLHGKSLTLYEEDKDLIEDFMLSNDQLVKLCSSNIKLIVNIRGAYSTIMTNNLNRIIKVLTVLTIVLTVPMIIASFYGMNVRLPLAASDHAFWIIVSITSVISACLFGIFVYKRWL